MSKMPLRSCEQLKLLFSAMFNDSNIVKSFRLGKTKCGYYVAYGIAPFFEREITKVLNKSPCYSVSFDENLNKIFHLEQMDFNIRFWDDELRVVKDNYFTSRFFERPNAENIENEIQAALKPVSEEKIIQLPMDGPNINWEIFDLLKSYREDAEWSNAENIENEIQAALKPVSEEKMIQLPMDGPNINWKLFDLLKSYREDAEWSSLLNLGSCSLLIIHGAFQTGNKATDWEIGKVLKAMWKIFNDSPARRELFVRVCEANSFPLRQCTMYFSIL